MRPFPFKGGGGRHTFRSHDHEKPCNSTTVHFISLLEQRSARSLAAAATNVSTIPFNCIVASFDCPAITLQTDRKSKDCQFKRGHVTRVTGHCERRMFKSEDFGFNQSKIKNIQIDPYYIRFISIRSGKKEIYEEFLRQDLYVKNNNIIIVLESGIT